jgi:hypothetical protein
LQDAKACGITDVDDLAEIARMAKEAAESANAEMAAEIVDTTLSTVIRHISDLDNVANFRPGALEHILEGELNASGKAVGFHSEGFPTSRGSTIPGTETPPNSFGVYKAKVQVDGVAKTSNGGYSTFFPKTLTPQQIVDSINEAFASKVFINGNTYRGMTSRGFTIEMYIDSSGKIISAFPVM